MAISHYYCHLLVNNGNLTLLLISSGQQWQFLIATDLTSSGQEWQFHLATRVYWSGMAIWHCYWCVVVKNGNFTLLLISTGQQWQFDIATDIYWSSMTISHCYWHIVVKNGNFTLLLTSSGQELQLADLPQDLPAALPPYTSWDIYYGMYLTVILYFTKKRWEFPFISE